MNRRKKPRGGTPANAHFIASGHRQSGAVTDDAGPPPADGYDLVLRTVDAPLRRLTGDHPFTGQALRGIGLVIGLRNLLFGAVLSLCGFFLCVMTVYMRITDSPDGDPYGWGVTLLTGPIGLGLVWWGVDTLLSGWARLRPLPVADVSVAAPRPHPYPAVRKSPEKQFERL